MIFKIIGFILRYIEVLLCIRKRPYRTYTFKKNAYCEYWHNKGKWRQEGEPRY